MIKKYFPSTNRELCYYHVNNNIMKNIARQGLTRFSKNLTESNELYIAGNFKKMLALPFLPADQIKPVYEKIRKNILDFVSQNEAALLSNFQSLFTTLDSKYYGNSERNQMFCKFQKTLRTTNIIEAVHRTMNTSFLFQKNASLAKTISGKI